MSQVEEFEFEEEMNSQVAAEQAGAEAVASESEPVEEVETKTEVVEEKAEETEVETTTTKEESWTFSQAMDEREKRQKAVAEADELRKKLEAYEKPEGDDISVFEDEAGFKAQQSDSVDEKVRNVGLNMSQAFAEETFGEDKVAAATKWMQDEGVKSPYILKEFNEAKLPFHKLVKLHEAEQARQNPDAIKSELRAEIRAEILAEMKGEPPEPETPIKSSLASSRSAGEPSAFPDNDEDIMND